MKIKLSFVIGHFDNEIDMAWLNKIMASKVEIKPQGW
jgi:S-adenosylhomocysteine hydrolase